MINIYRDLPDIPLQPAEKNYESKKPPAVKGRIKPTSDLRSSDMEKATQKMVKTATERKPVLLHEVKKVPYISAEVLKEKLKPGDIILSYFPSNTKTKDFVLRTGQKMSKLVTRTSTDESHNFIHAALHVGDGRISEAVAKGVVINELEGERYKLKPGMDHGFLIVRPKNDTMAKEAACIADELAGKGDQDVPLKFSVTRAVFSTVRSSVLDEEGIKRYLKGSCYAHNKTLPMDKNGIRDFFCSYFVGWAFQAGESIDIINRVNARLDKEDQITFPDVSKVPEKGRGVVLEEWAKKTAHTHYVALKENVKLDFDPKWTSPQRLYGFILEHPELFSQEMLIVPPEAETEMKKMSKKPIGS